MMKKQIFLIMGMTSMVHGGKFVAEDGSKYDAEKLIKEIILIDTFMSIPSNRKFKQHNTIADLNYPLYMNLDLRHIDQYVKNFNEQNPSTP